VGSVKALPHQVANEHAIPFIGSHPMAGSEKTGIEAARADLFKRAACALTNDQERPNEELQAVARFWEKLGCVISVMIRKTMIERLRGSVIFLMPWLW
jgi:prephenate dehydrogenase